MSQREEMAVKEMGWEMAVLVPAMCLWGRILCLHSPLSSSAQGPSLLQPPPLTPSLHPPSLLQCPRTFSLLAALGGLSTESLASKRFPTEPAARCPGGIAIDLESIIEWEEP